MGDDRRGFWDAKAKAKVIGEHEESTSEPESRLSIRRLLLVERLHSLSLSRTKRGQEKIRVQLREESGVHLRHPLIKPM